MLANVYLHYVLDLWFEKGVKSNLRGKAFLVRFADDFIILCQYEDEARAIYKALVERLQKFGLEVEQDKTHILPFGRFKGTKETFDFLGFTHFNSVTRTGKYTVGHKVAKKKKRAFKANLTKWVKENRNTDLVWFMTKLNLKMTGAFRYYGISGTFIEIKQMHRFGMWTTFKWLNRRSQRKSFNLESFKKVWDSFIRKPRIYVDIWQWRSA